MSQTALDILQTFQLFVLSYSNVVNRTQNDREESELLRSLLTVTHNHLICTLHHKRQIDQPILPVLDEKVEQITTQIHMLFRTNPFQD